MERHLRAIHTEACQYINRPLILSRNVVRYRLQVPIMNCFAQRAAFLSFCEYSFQSGLDGLFVTYRALPNGASKSWNVINETNLPEMRSRTDPTLYTELATVRFPLFASCYPRHMKYIFETPATSLSRSLGMPLVFPRNNFLWAWKHIYNYTYRCRPVRSSKLDEERVAPPTYLEESITTMPPPQQKHGWSIEKNSLPQHLGSIRA